MELSTIMIISSELFDVFVLQSCRVCQNSHHLSWQSLMPDSVSNTCLKLI